MKKEELIKAMAQLGKLMRSLGNKDDGWDGFQTGITLEEYELFDALIERQVSYNGWFVKENVRKALLALGDLLTEDALTLWTSSYSFSEMPKRVALIMAGNIPLVGFHDFLCVLLSGNVAVCKLSSDDRTLLPALVHHLVQFFPEVEARIELTTGRISEIDAVIATGSTNSLAYFEQYFGKYPHIFRRNRTSVAVITGDETVEDFDALGHDIFDYFGLGCRNVSHLLVPRDVELNRFFEGIIGHAAVVNNHKYANNYDYNKAVYLLNQANLLDNHFVLLRESTELFSPLSMVHYQYYDSFSEVVSFLDEEAGNIQAVVGKKYIPFGKSQCPALNDYADGIDTMRFLSEL